MSILNLFPLGGLDVAAMPIAYTGAYTDVVGATLRTITLTSSGTLTIGDDVTASTITLLGGGGGGGYGKKRTTTCANGGDGGGGYWANLTNKALATGSFPISIGAGGNAGTSVGVATNGGTTTAFGASAEGGGKGGDGSIDEDGYVSDGINGVGGSPNANGGSGFYWGTTASAGGVGYVKLELPLDQ